MAGAAPALPPAPHSPGRGTAIPSDGPFGQLTVLRTLGAAPHALLAEEIARRGGALAVVIPPDVAIAFLPESTAGQVVGTAVLARPGVDALPDDSSPNVRAALAAFRSVTTPNPATVSADASQPPPLSGDALERPALTIPNVIANLRAAAPLALTKVETADVAQGTSTYMSGSVAVRLFCVESDGTATDPDLYSWTSQDEQQAISDVTTGLLWWATQAQGRQCALYFVLSTSRATTNPQCSQWREPLLHASTAFYLAITDVLGKFGYAIGNHLERCEAFNLALRAAEGTQWAYSVFMAANPWPAPAQFTDGYAAWAYLGGPYAMMLQRTFSWPLPLVVSHETGHIFYACDEYYQAGYGGCTSCQICSSAGVENGNCEYCNPSSVACMMRYNSDNVCLWTEGQIGWQRQPCSPRITGRVVDDGGQPLSGVRMSGTVPVQETDASGDYALDVGYTWSGTVTPTLSGYRFVPPSRNYGRLKVDASAQDFTAPSAPGMNLSWNDGGSLGTESLTSACGADTGYQDLVVTFRAPGGITDLLGIETSLMVQSESDSLPPWWRLWESGCRADALTSIVDFSHGSATCADPWAGVPAVGGHFATAYPDDVANRERITVAVASDPPTGVALQAGREYYVCRLRLANRHTVGAGACAGCDVPVCVRLQQVKLRTASTEVTLTDSIGTRIVGWQGAPCSPAWFAPRVDSIVPRWSAADSVVRIHGARFASDDPYGMGSPLRVFFDGSEAQFSLQGPTLIAATVPPGAGNGPVTVQNVYGVGTSAEPFGVTAVQAGGFVHFRLSPPRPNPTDGRTVIAWGLPRQADVRLDVFAIDGSRVWGLRERACPAGQHQRVWEGRDAAGRMVPAGVYFVRLQADGRTLGRRICVLR